MIVLAIESSGMTASAALCSEEHILAEYTICNKKTHSQTLLPMIDELFLTSQIDPDAVDAIAISKGPGSFTGLRIGSATAKGIALAWKKPLVEVDTLAAMAYSFWGNPSLLCPMCDARRSRVFTGVYTFENGELITILEPCVLPVEELKAFLSQKAEEMNRNICLTGDGVSVYRDLFGDELPVITAPEFLNRQKASSVAALGLKLLKEGKAIDGALHAPEYLSVSQAEREREERLKREQQ